MFSKADASPVEDSAQANNLVDDVCESILVCSRVAGPTETLYVIVVTEMRLQVGKVFLIVQQQYLHRGRGSVWPYLIELGPVSAPVGRNGQGDIQCSGADWHLHLDTPSVGRIRQDNAHVRKARRILERNQCPLRMHLAIGH